MADIELSSVESAPTFTSQLPLLVWEVEGDSSGKWWHIMFDGKIQLVWVASGTGSTRNARRALGVQQVEVDQAMVDFLTGAEGDSAIILPVLVPKPA